MGASQLSVADGGVLQWTKTVVFIPVCFIDVCHFFDRFELCGRAGVHGAAHVLPLSRALVRGNVSQLGGPVRSIKR